MKLNSSKTQLFLLHFAGGSIYSYDFLKKHIGLEFIPLELPGRGKRFSEKLLKTKEAAVEDYFRQIVRLRNNQPFIIYGHSMGATLALSIVERLEKIEDFPVVLIVSGNSGPGNSDDDLDLSKKPKRYLMNDSDFKEVLKNMGGVPDEVIENIELFELFNPIMRADFEILEKDDFFERDIKLKSPIFALMGTEEKTKDKIENWMRFTNSRFEYTILEGNHFFIYNHSEEISRCIMDRLSLQNLNSYTY